MTPEEQMLAAIKRQEKLRRKAAQAIKHKSVSQVHSDLRENKKRGGAV